MEYKINENQLKAINIMIKLLNIAINRNCFTNDEEKLIFDKIKDINVI